MTTGWYRSVLRNTTLCEGINRSPVVSPHKGPIMWCVVLICLICCQLEQVFKYCQTFSIRHTKSQHLSSEARCYLENAGVVGAAPIGDAPTTSEWSTILLPTKVRLELEVWRYTLMLPVISHDLRLMRHQCNIIDDSYDWRHIICSAWNSNSPVIRCESIKWLYICDLLRVVFSLI